MQQDSSGTKGPKLQQKDGEVELESIGQKKWSDQVISVLEGLRREKKLYSYLKMYQTQRTRAMNLKMGKGYTTKELRWKSRASKIKQVQQREQ